MQKNYTTTHTIVEQRAAAHRANPTYPESVFADRLDRAGMAYKFQHVIYPYIVDFLLRDNLIVELDGKTHDSVEAKEYDARRDKYLRARGYKLIRIRNKAVWKFDLWKLGGRKKKKKASKKQRLRFDRNRKRDQKPRQNDGYCLLDRLEDLKAIRPL